jgi:hypothetical protein
MRYPYYLQTDDEAGEVRLLQDGICIAHAKSRNSMVKIRDALNAPVPLEGAWVSKETHNGVEVGVVQAVASNVLGFKLLVRIQDDTLTYWLVDEGSEVVRVIDKPPES